MTTMLETATKEEQVQSELRKAAGELAHAFNNKLTVISGNISLALLYGETEMLAKVQAAQQACEEAARVTLQEFPEELDRIIDGIREDLMFAMTKLKFISGDLDAEQAEIYLKEAEEYGDKAKELTAKLLAISKGEPVSLESETVDTEGVAPEPEEMMYGSGRILLMDDEDAVRMAISGMLQILGYEVVEAIDGEETLGLYESGKFVLVILDLVNEKGLGGQATMAKLREFDPNVVAVVSSGYCNEPIIDRYEEYGFKGAIVKPYKIGPLSVFIAQILANPQGALYPNHVGTN